MSGVPAGAERIAPGVYAHGRELHIDGEELCRAHGVPVTEGNLMRLVRAALAVTEKQGIPLEVHEK